MKTTDIDAIFWDFDGVIADSMHIKNAAFEKLFTPYGQSVVKKVMAHHIAHGGISRVVKIDHYYREFLSNSLSPEALESKCQEFSDLVVEEVVNANSIPGAVPFLEKYHTEIDMFVISGTPQDELKKIVSSRQLERVFGPFNDDGT